MNKAKSINETETQKNFCPQCGQQQTLRSKFCANCGHDLSMAEMVGHGIHPQSSKTSPVLWLILIPVIGILGIGILAILASIVIVAINPTKQLQDARNVQRRADINTILNAIYQYAIDHNGELPVTLPQTPEEICRSQTSNCYELVDLSPVIGDYLVVMPSDPATNDSRSTKYTIVYDSEGKITVNAPAAEGGVSISVTR